MNTKHRAIVLGLLGAVAPAVVAGQAAQPAAHSANHAAAGTATAATLKADMRKLWEDHIIWTRNFIISAAADLPDKQVVTERLLRNQADIGNAIKPYYGDAAGEQLTALLRGHITTAAELVTAAKANDQGRSHIPYPLPRPLTPERSFTGNCAGAHARPAYIHES